MDEAMRVALNLPEGTEVRTMDLRPGDVLVILAPEPLSPAVAERIRNLVQVRLGHRRVMVLDAGLDVAVIRPEDVEQADRDADTAARAGAEYAGARPED